MNFDCLDEHNIKYEVAFRKVKRMRLTFRNGILYIIYPIGCKKTSVEEFINNHIDWIIKNKSLSDIKKISFENGSIHYLFGKPLTLYINYSKTPRLDIIDDKMIVSIKNENDVSKMIENMRKEKAEFVFSELLFRCFSKMGDSLKTFPTLVIKKSKSKWGCCYYNENKIMLNYNLTQAPIELIEYVIFHELTHFIHHNHSSLFHQELIKYVPNERKLSKCLKQYSNE